MLSPNTSQENSGGAKTGETANLLESFVLVSTFAERHLSAFLSATRKGPSTSSIGQVGCRPETAQERTPSDCEPRGRPATLGSLRWLPSLPGVPSQETLLLCQHVTL